MVLKIRAYGDGVLREKARPVAAVTDAERSLASDMLETMRKAGGVGIAAQQVGRLERMCVIDIPDGCENDEDAAFNAPIQMPLVMFNPEIVSREGAVKDKEGCLSFPDVGGSVVRARRVVFTFVDSGNMPQTMMASGFLARAVQHEIDHLDGILYIDRMTAMERLSHAPRLKKLSKANGGTR